jgi:hypothetical protein
MKNITKLSLLFFVTSSIVGCTNNVNVSSSNIDSSSVESSSSHFSVPTSYSVSKEAGISLDDFTQIVDATNTENYRHVRITYHITETIVGDFYVSYKDNKGYVPEGELVTDFVIESYDSSNGRIDFKVISDNITTSGPDQFKSGTSLTMKAWLSYHDSQRKRAESSQFEIGYEERFYSSTDTYNMWFETWGYNLMVPSGYKYEGDYFALEEYNKTFNKEGYLKHMYYRCNRVAYGEMLSANSSEETKHYNGTYEMVLNAEVAYLD